MAKQNGYMVQITGLDIEPLIKTLAEEDMRSIGNELAWLVRKEYNARHPKTLEELNTHAAKADKSA
jgi:hypothetical protein